MRISLARKGDFIKKALGNRQVLFLYVGHEKDVFSGLLYRFELTRIFNEIFSLRKT